MTGWALVFLAMIAVATLTMALIQVGAIIYAARIAARTDRLLKRIEADLEPLVARLTTISGEAARIATIAGSQADRVDVLLTDLTTQIEDLAVQFRRAVIAPGREGLALLTGLRAAFVAFKGGRGRPRRGEDEDALFIG